MLPEAMERIQDRAEPLGAGAQAGLEARVADVHISP